MSPRPSMLRSRVSSATLFVVLVSALGCGPEREGATSERSPRGVVAPSESLSLASYFPLALGDRWRSVTAPGGAIAHHGVTAIDARGRAVVHGTDRAVIELFRAGPTRVERVSPSGTSLGIVLEGPLVRGTRFVYEGGEGANRPSCEGRIVEDDAHADVDGLLLARCLVVERRCTHAATPPLPPGTRELHEETYCPGVGLVRDHVRFDPALPEGSLLGERTTTVIGFRTRGGPVPSPRGGLDCDDAIVLPTDVLAACGGGPFQALELGPDRPGADCESAFVSSASPDPVRIRVRRLDHPATPHDVETVASSLAVPGSPIAAEGRAIVLVEAVPAVCPPERLGRLLPLLRSIVR